MNHESLRLDTRTRFPELPPIPWRAHIHEERIPGLGVRDILGGRFGLQHLFHGLFNPPTVEVLHHLLSATTAKAMPSAMAVANLRTAAMMLPPKAAEHDLGDHEGEAQEKHPAASTPYPPTSATGAA